MGTIQIDGSTPKLTIGNATAEDATILFDGNAQDFYIALDDSADDLLIGLGSTVGTTPAISIDENLKVAMAADATVGDDLTLLSDSSVLGFGADTDTTLTHTDGTGLTLNSTNKLCFNDASQFIQGASNAILALGATDEIDLTATAVDLNGTLDVSGNSQFSGTVTVGVDDTGKDVKFFGASAGSYLEWDESADQLRIMGASADATTSTGKLLLATSLTDINANDVLGKIDFQAPHEAGGTDAITVAASIRAIAQATFTSSVNATDLIFYTGHSEAAAEKVRITSQNEIGIAGANYGTDGQVLTSGGAGAAVAWENAGGGTWVQLHDAESAVDVSSVSADDIFDSGNYDAYKIIIHYFAASAHNNEFRFVFRDGGSDLTATSYIYAGDAKRHGATDAISSGSDSAYGVLTEDVQANDTNTNGVAAEFTVMTTGSNDGAAAYPRLYGHGTYHPYDETGSLVSFHSASMYKVATEPDGIKFYWGTGNIISYRWTIYGIKVT